MRAEGDTWRGIRIGSRKKRLLLSLQSRMRIFTHSARTMYVKNAHVFGVASYSSVLQQGIGDVPLVRN